MSLSNATLNDFSRGAEDTLAAIYSLSGYEVSQQEAALFKESNPFGFILFQRNCDSPEQLAALTKSLKDLVGRDCPILIDQEGGRVERLKPPKWRGFPTMQSFGDLYESDPEQALENLRFETLRLAEELLDGGVNVNCAPVLDLIFDGAHDIIGDRSFSSNPEIVARLGLSVCRHFLNAGVTPIIKHIPGHGRAGADSHLELPYIDTPYETLSKTDFHPFREIANSEVGAHIWAMTAHITYQNIDNDAPVSVSAKAIENVIRSDIGFDGILIGDDLDMKALDAYGSISDKALQSLDAGCDLALYCSGDFDKMQELSNHLPKVSKETLSRLKGAASA